MRCCLTYKIHFCVYLQYYRIATCMQYDVQYYILDILLLDESLPKVNYFGITFLFRLTTILSYWILYVGYIWNVATSLRVSLGSNIYTGQSKVSAHETYSYRNRTAGLSPDTNKTAGWSKAQSSAGGVGPWHVIYLIAEICDEHGLQETDWGHCHLEQRGEGNILLPLAISYTGHGLLWGTTLLWNALCYKCILVQLGWMLHRESFSVYTLAFVFAAF